MGHPKNLTATADPSAAPRDDNVVLVRVLVCGGGGAGQGQDYAGEEEGVEEVVDAFDFHFCARVAERVDQDWAVDDYDEQDDPGAEVGGGEQAIRVTLITLPSESQQAEMMARNRPQPVAPAPL